jgi:hypothetical protein
MRRNSRCPKVLVLTLSLMVVRKSAAVAILALAASFSLLFSLSAVASSPGSVSPAAKEREATAEKYVQHSLRLWQQRLNLTGWNIKVSLVRPSALEPKTLGNIHWDLDTKTATIDVLSAYDYSMATPEMLDDMEFTIVHELVHLHLAALPKNAGSVPTEEYAVNQLARALIDLEKNTSSPQ